MASSTVRCRPIGEGDLEPVIDLLRRGFPTRPRHYWARGLRRMGERDIAPEDPRYGYVLETDGRLVGVVLLIFCRPQAPDPGAARCNLSSWYVEPEHRSHASQLVFAAMRRKDVTYVNISAARHTWPAVEAQGFVRYATGLFVALAALGPAVPGTRVDAFDPLSPAAARLAPEERRLLAAHVGYGCLGVVAVSSDAAIPFVFLPVRARGGHLPLACAQIIFCRGEADVVRFAGPIGRFLLRRAGTPFVLFDATGPIDGLIGRYLHARRPKFFKGPDRPRTGDLAYTELALFGP